MSKLTIKTSQVKLATKGKRTPQEEFQHCWQQIEKAKKNLIKTREEQSVVVERFNCELLPLEQEICQLQFSVLEKLASFTDKKSLSENQTIELLDWIEEVYGSLMSSPFRVDLDLDGVMVKVRSNQAARLTQDSDALEVLRESINQEVGFDLALTDDDLMSILIDPDILLQKINQAVTAKNAEQEERGVGESEDDLADDEHFDDFESFFNQTFGCDSAPLEGGKNELFLSKGVLNRCYKKLANRFHPDKVKPEDKEESHALMVELSKAKKANDAFTIFMLYQTHIHDDDFVFSDEELKNINFLLSIKLSELQSEINEVKYGNAMDALICRKFKGRSKRATEANFALHRDELEERIYRYHGYSDLKTVKVLKEYLAERRKMSMFYW